MEIMGISGLPGSGKSLVSEIATKKGAVVVSMGDIIREEAKKRGESSKETATNLRKEHGKYIVAQLTIEKIKQMIEDKLATTIIVEGIRSPFEVKMFKENFDNFIILSIFANPAIRFKRLQERNREDDSKNYEDFLKRDQMELDFGIGTVISLSDKIIINEKDLESYEKEINEFLKENTTL
ncbi:nucleoside monophosphate kinase [Methanobrevibacter sp. TLL-48-HuF1]|uniref:nucleoside monophosphate kinase n=1 Tax=Methanobrevibacter TaxID=2172 RepID=UPI002025E618|nr:nucleoside monophosphate kinase [Methanobrevibacter sp. TLL-48-HuF1]URN49640.1 nucleoside monophosphate kinase [Methanobrevibacter sp. TLL-48-HuF1]